VGETFQELTETRKHNAHYSVINVAAVASYDTFVNTYQTTRLRKPYHYLSVYEEKYNERENHGRSGRHYFGQGAECVEICYVSSLLPLVLLIDVT
jgi:hypothetical protein